MGGRGSTSSGAAKTAQIIANGEAAIYEYTKGSTTIIAAQMGTLLSSISDEKKAQLENKAAAIEDYIEYSVNNGDAWSAKGLTYRGIVMPADDYKQLQKGAVISANRGAMSSWSYSESIARSFATGVYTSSAILAKKSGSSKNVILVSTTQNKGIDITGLSHFKSQEGEVLVSKSASYQITRVSQRKNSSYTYVYVKEV